MTESPLSIGTWTGPLRDDDAMGQWIHSYWDEEEDVTFLFCCDPDPVRSESLPKSCGFRALVEQWHGPLRLRRDRWPGGCIRVSASGAVGVTCRCAITLMTIYSGNRTRQRSPRDAPTIPRLPHSTSGTC